MKLARFFYLLFIFITVQVQAAPPEGWTENKVFIFPNEGRKPWIDAIQQATESIDIAAYKLSDPTILNALKKAVAEKKIKVNLLIEPNTFEHEKSDNVKSPLDDLKALGIQVYAHQPQQFNQYHYKMIVVDKEWGLISTGNLDAESFDGIKDAPGARDFAVPILDQDNITEMLRVFEADTHERRIVPLEKPLVWGPDFQRSTFLKLIHSAEKSIDIYQQDFQDVGLAKAVAAAAKDGVKVRVLMMPYPFSKKEDKNIPNQKLLKEAGASIGLFEGLYVHAKVVIIDNKVMYIGSGNFYTPSVDQTRELGILIDNPAQIQAVKAVYEKDWSQSRINQHR